MAKRASLAITAAGAALIAAALLLLLFNCREDARAGQSARRVLPKVAAAAEKSEKNPPPRGKTALLPGEISEELPEAVVEGAAYVGWLELPALDLTLPVLSQWDEEGLKTAPCRHFGSSRRGDLVIAAHNYSSHFGRLGELSPGDRVIFTDMDGMVNTYRVEKTEVLSPEAVEAVRHSGYALVLYTCTRGGRQRLAVFCTSE